MKRLVRNTVGLGLVAGVCYLAVIGFCNLVGIERRPTSFTEGLHLSPDERIAVDRLTERYLATKQDACAVLCAKRAQLIRLIREEQPDIETMHRLVEEIAQVQMGLERATLEHLLAVGRLVGPRDRQQLIDRVTERLRMACRMTACGETPDCTLRDH